MASYPGSLVVSAKGQVGLLRYLFRYGGVDAMLGEQIVEESGKLTVLRVLPSEGDHPRVEVSFQRLGRSWG
jgi:hypothetical protein